MNLPNSKTKTIDTQLLMDIIFAINSQTDYYSLLNVILTKMRQLTACDAGTLYILEEGKLHFRIIQNETLHINESSGDPSLLPPIVLDENNIQNVCAYAAIKNTFVNIADVYESTAYNFQGPKNYDKLTGYRTCSMLVFPLANIENEVVGVLQLINARDDDNQTVIPFDESLYSILNSISRLAAVVLTNIRYTIEIKEQFYSFVRIMSAAIDERTPYNATHTKMVAKYVDLFTDFLSTRFSEGDPLFFDKNRKEQLIMSAFLHDIGKIVTPIHIMNKATRLSSRFDKIAYRFDMKKLQLALAHQSGGMTSEQYEAALAEVNDAYDLVVFSDKTPFLPPDTLLKIKDLSRLTYTDRNGKSAPLLDSDDIHALSVQKGTLTDEEFAIMKNHVGVTARLLSNMKFNRYYKDVPVWAVNHHEFLDGTGYPNGCQGDQIPIEVCILTMLDIFDALVASDRPYKKGMPPNDAIKILSAMVAEGKLHKELVELFIESGIGMVSE